MLQTLTEVEIGGLVLVAGLVLQGQKIGSSAHLNPGLPALRAALGQQSLDLVHFG